MIRDDFLNQKFVFIFFYSQLYTTVPSVIVASRHTSVYVSQFARPITRRRGHGHVEDITDIQGKSVLSTQRDCLNNNNIILCTRGAQVSLKRRISTYLMFYPLL